MDDVDLYVSPPAEPRPPPRLVRLRPALALLAVALLILGLMAVIGLRSAREDPSLQLPDEADALVVPTATEPE